MKFYPKFICHKYTNKPIVKFSIDVGNKHFQPIKLILIDEKWINCNSYRNKKVTKQLSKIGNWMLNNTNKIEYYLSNGKHLKANEQNWTGTIDKRNIFEL